MHIIILHLCISVSQINKNMNVLQECFQTLGSQKKKKMKENGLTVKTTGNRWYSAEIITEESSADNLAFLANTHALIKYLLNSLEEAEESMDSMSTAM